MVCEAMRQPAGANHEEPFMSTMSRWRPVCMAVYFCTVKVDDQGLESLQVLPKLSCLSPADTKVTDNGLKHLTKLTDLKKLFLQNTKLTAEQWRHSRVFQRQRY